MEKELDDHKFKKIFSIHFPGRKVYVNSTFKKLNEKMKYIKEDKDHCLYYILKNIQIQKFYLRVIKI